MKARLSAILIFVVVLSLAGCTELDSRDIRTSGIYTDISVNARPDRTDVNVDLRTGNSIDADSILLTTGDRLFATLAGDRLLLINIDTGYNGSFNDNSSRDVTVALIRNDGVSAPASTVTTPAEFQITAPDLADTFNAGDSITVAWTPTEPGRTATVDYFLNCQTTDTNGVQRGAAFGRAFDIIDSGTHTTTISEILNAFGSQNDLVSGVSCPMSVSVTRTSIGVLDPALTQGGSIIATRQKSVVVNVIP